MTGLRYGAFDDGPDPLAEPSDPAKAVDELGDRVLAGSGATESMRDLLREGINGGGLQDLLEQVQRRQRQLRRTGRLDGTLEQAKQMLDEAVELERAELFPRPSDDARFRESMLDSLPSSTSRAVSELSSYDWQSALAAARFDELKQLLRSEVLEQQFAGLRDAMQRGAADPDATSDEAPNQAVKDMIADLNQLLAKRSLGTDSQADFDQFMARHGSLVPGSPTTLDELLEELARRAAAMDRLLRSLPPDEAAELMSLMQEAINDDVDLAAGLAQLGDHLRDLRPDLFRGGRERMSGSQPLSLADATGVLSELAELDALAEQLGQSYAGATLDDVDEELVRRALGRQAVDDLHQLRQIERELIDQGYLLQANGELELTAKAVRRLGLTALRRVFADLSATRRGGHDVRDAGAAGETTGGSRPWQLGDEQPLDVVRSLTNAIRRGTPLRLVVDDLEVVETERRSAAAVCLLVDTSWSMVLNGTWGEAKQTALALNTLVETKYPQDAMQVIAFSDYARPIASHELAAMDFADVQGTNLQHALHLAGRFLDRHAGLDPVVIVVTDGEPTARLLSNGRSWFSWPPEEETLAVTLAEFDAMTRRRARVNIFRLGEDPRLVDFVESVARRNGGRVFAPQDGRLGEYVVSDFLSRRTDIARRGHR